jgi:hypothetical protein
MKVKMLEYYQGHRIVGAFVPGEEYEVEKSLGAYLLEHRKAVEIIEPINIEAKEKHVKVVEEKKPEPKAKPAKKAVKK